MVPGSDVKLRSQLTDADEPQRKSQIVEATLRIIQRDGWGRVTIRAIAAELGLTTGVLWYYFADKRDILKAALLKALEPWRMLVDAALAHCDAWKALGAMFLPGEAGTEAQFAQAWPNVVSELRQDPELWALYRQEYGAFRQALADLLAKCQAQGAIDPTRDAPLEADRLCAVFDGVLIAMWGEPDRMTSDYAQRIMACHLAQLGTRELPA